MPSFQDDNYLCEVPRGMLRRRPQGSEVTADDAPHHEVLDEKVPFEGSRVATEHKWVREMLEENPEMQAAVSRVLKRFKSKSFECSEASLVDFWRRATAHYVEHPHPSYDDLDPFFIIDFGRVMIQMAKFRRFLPMVQPHYAVKCNDSECLIAMISALGGSYDCASQKEIRQILKGNYAKPEDIIFANPCKQVSCMRYAEESGVRHVTFDNVNEVEKLSKHMPNCKAVLRIKTSDEKAVCAFSTKFGASMSDVPILLKRAKELGVDVCGVSFHVGSGNNDPDAYTQSILNARNVFDQAIALGFEMKLLDLGGGLPGTEPTIGPNGKPNELNFEEICAVVAPVLVDNFSNATVIAEPGRFFSASTHMLAVNVHSMRVVPLPAAFPGALPDSTNQEYQYYINDGLYHSFNCIVFDHAHPPLYLLKPDEETKEHISTIFGPTCDSLDCVLKRQPFPELAIGDWLFVPSFGAYTTAAGAPFNGFATRRVEYIMSIPELSL